MKKYAVLKEDFFRAAYAMAENSVSPFDIGIPLFEASDKTLEEIYYFRWSVYAKHIRKTPEGFVITEFLPDVPWAGKYNTISCAASHHFAEGRWLHNTEILSDYAKFWVSEEAEPRKYSFPLAHSVYSFCKIKGDFSLALSVYGKLIKNYEEWERGHKTENGLFYQTDNRDGMELSISGNGLRPTINSYMYADAVAISKIAELKGLDEDARLYKEKAENLRSLINERLWDKNDGFYKNLSEKFGFKTADVRELIGYVPWCYSIPENDFCSAFEFLFDKNHFDAPFGPTTAERCHPHFMQKHSHECLWNGPSWPFATTQTLSAMIELLGNYEQSYVTAKDFYALLFKYASCHYIEENGKRTTFIDENLEPFTGKWLARDILLSAKPERSDRHRGKDYNHSAFCDLIVRGLCGLDLVDSSIRFNPLFDKDKIDYFCLDGAYVNGRYYTVIYDKYGTKYNRGKGIFFFKSEE